VPEDKNTTALGKLFFSDVKVGIAPVASPTDAAWHQILGLPAGIFKPS
jgi:hypothetical protein